MTLAQWQQLQAWGVVPYDFIYGDPGIDSLWKKSFDFFLADDLVDVGALSKDPGRGQDNSSQDSWPANGPSLQEGLPGETPAESAGSYRPSLYDVFGPPAITAVAELLKPSAINYPDTTPAKESNVDFNDFLNSESFLQGPLLPAEVGAAEGIFGGLGASILKSAGVTLAGSAIANELSNLFGFQSTGSVSGAAPKASLLTGACPPGRTLRRVSLGRDICIKKPRMNPLNPHALRRAARRMSGFHAFAVRTEKELQKVMRKGGFHANTSTRRGSKCTTCRKSKCSCG